MIQVHHKRVQVKTESCIGNPRPRLFGMDRRLLYPGRKPTTLPANLRRLMDRF
jgi:hypothetical protein